MTDAAIVAVCLLAGLLIGALIGWRLRSGLQSRLEAGRVREQTLREEMENTFKALASDVVQGNSEAFLAQAAEQFKSLKERSEQDLETKKKLIDASLTGMNERLDNIHRQSTALKASIETHQRTTEELGRDATRLREVLASSQQRGQWGERMVEDILGVIGLVERVNYTKQTRVESGQRPDFTFLLPQQKKLNMDVKFPLSHYEKFIDAADDRGREAAKGAFLKSVRDHVKSVGGKEYINPAEDTLDYVMLFIPNESIYAFVNSEDAGLIDFALKQRVVLCSPLMLYAMLSLIHQATRNFLMNERTAEILALVGKFQKQWEMYVGQMDKLGRSLVSAKRDYDELTNRRQRALDRPLAQIQEIGIEAPKEDLNQRLVNEARAAAAAPLPPSD